MWTTAGAIFSTTSAMKLYRWRGLSGFPSWPGKSSRNVSYYIILYYSGRWLVGLFPPTAPPSANPLVRTHKRFHSNRTRTLMKGAGIVYKSVFMSVLHVSVLRPPQTLFTPNMMFLQVYDHKWGHNAFFFILTDFWSLWHSIGEAFHNHWMHNTLTLYEKKRKTSVTFFSSSRQRFPVVWIFSRSGSMHDRLNPCD